MIEHKRKGSQHLVTPLTERAALFLNTFVGRTLVMTSRDWQSVCLEMSAHKVWVMGEL
jgi:hypothetical protein